MSLSVPTAAEKSIDGITLEITPAFTASQIQSLMPIATGEVFSVAKIRDGLKAIQDLYGEHGYIDLATIP
jgi:outer membrane protein assembly factor BamA